ncbi:MAG: bifunctional DNA-formamidopyrimidine glycosylase/DNA-(apurinic or apyrimidinic site) lyase [Gammaproteobacteria bacterium]|nr:bifunctional DNA-formamidopyrimidine glycosylase/DNA-(apurinic or apyrimidinic site) lyase [Gammaproteobacteria bacterium]
MPELPEVETTRRGIAPHLLGQRLDRLRVRERRLRWPIEARLPGQVQGQRMLALSRRGKYLLLQLEQGHLLIHLGMSGSLRILPADRPATKHDHFDLVFGDCCLRFHDPRRFGALLWTSEPPEQHPLLARLGPEPLTNVFDGSHLYRLARGRRTPVKQFIMDGKVVVGVGNIYASEALYRAGIHPSRGCGRISLARYLKLAEAIKAVLKLAIERGGTTLRDFVDSEGRPGYFAQQLLVYGRAGEPCAGCNQALVQRTIGQRASYYCPRCQR